MIFPGTFEQKLGFDTLRQWLCDHCLGPLGRAQVEEIVFSTDAQLIDRKLAQAAEMRSILEGIEPFPSQDYYDLIPALGSIRVAGSYLEPPVLSELRLSLTTLLAIYQFFGERSLRYPALSAPFLPGTASGLEAPPGGEGDDEPVGMTDVLKSLLRALDGLIDDRSEVRDNASPELQRIRREKASKMASVERQMVAAFRMARQQGWVPDDAEITMRNGRLVIPMISTHKRKIQGFVHDASSTGQTVYLEPVEIFETNNAVRELEYEERREIVRILIAFAALLRPHADLLVKGYRLLGQVDLVRAKALLAIATEGRKPMAILPGTKPATYLLWRGALHPLLYLSHTRQKREVVPLDLTLNEAQRILIISGPNAGGKSVCLKSVGLIQYMYQCGLLPPVKEDSEFSIFEKIFIDIGDEQSIDNDLSTYTSKLHNLKFFIGNSDASTLFLIDELGTGTDPSLGGAIAEATLEALNDRGACGVVTTHYSNLKLLAARQPGIANGAMLFDLKRLKPLYRLSTGKPGSSFALEIAREIGFPAGVLDAAREKTGRSQLDFDRELQNLEVERDELSRRTTQLEVADAFLSELVAKYEKLNATLEKERKEILARARSEAKEVLDNANRLIERTVKEIREAQADKEKTKAARAVVEGEKRRLESLQSELPLPDPPPGGDGGAPLQRSPGKGESDLTPRPPLLKGEGGVNSRKPTGTSAHQHIGTSRSAFSGFLADLQAKHDRFKLTLDLRGMRVDEAQTELQRYIDDALLLSMHEVRILHGKGNGVLRQVTRDYLRSVKEVKSARDEKLELGGAGITVVELK